MTEITVNTPKVIQLDVETYVSDALEGMFDRIENDWDIELEYINQTDKETIIHDFIAEFARQLSDTIL